jgi:phosphoglycolate phosphatase-like HAD superfamily hydrolase
VSGARYVILDLDDTLIGTADASFAAAVAASGRLGLTRPSWDAFLSGYRGLPFRECVRRWFGPTVDFDEFSGHYWDAVRYRPIGDVPALVRELRDRGVPAGIVTNSTLPETALKLASAGLAGELFDFVAGRAEAPGAAPEKDLGRILRERRIDPATAVHVSDNPADSAPSVRAGLPFRGVLTGVYTAAEFTAAGVPPAAVHPDVHTALHTATHPTLTLRLRSSGDPGR